MDITIIIAVIVLGVIAIIVFLNSKLSSIKTKDDTATIEWLKNVTTRLNQQTEQLISAQRAIGEMSEIGK